MKGDASLKIDKALFEAAAALEDPQLREEFLGTACGSDAARRARIEGWLDARAAAESFFRTATIVREQAGAEVAATLVEDRPAERLADGLPGSRIGHYRVLEKIGEGGCGSVYLVEQGEPVRRRVALKILRLGMDTARVLARFDMERQTLALMDHPHIARVFDAGVSEDGRPFFVMELVQGVRITEHCDARRLSLRQRLELFIQVCQAIQHAHQKGIIHRDIKPSNVLISEQDGVAVPKVIDFGIARAVEGRLPDETHATVQGQLLGTPAYMSPEQAEGGQDPDTRGDVYSLGVMLHELLTGRTPFDGQRLAQAGLLEMLRILREEEAPAPSAALAKMEVEEAAAVAAARDITTTSLVAALRGDLDGIVAKAMTKDREGRYDTVNGLAMDLRRHLDDEPVSARPPGRLYLFRKLMRRHKLAFSAAAAVSLALVAGLAVSSWFYLREREARQVQVRLREAADAARANEARLLQQSKARESVSLAAMRLADGKIEEADALLLKTPPASIEPSREAAGLFLTLGDWHAIRGRAGPAAECYALFLQANRLDRSPASPGNMMSLLAIGPTLVEGGRITDYLHFRDEVTARSEKISEPITTSSLLKATLLMPAEAALLEQLRPHAERQAKLLGTPAQAAAFGAYQSAFAALSLAMMAYRSGDFKEALEWCDKCLAYPDKNQARSGAIHAIAALAAQQLGQAEQARAELEQARQVFVAPFTPDVVYPRGEGNGYWLDWAIARVFLREAESAISTTGNPPR